MKIIAALAGTAVSALVLSATPSQAQFFDSIFAAPAAVATGAVGVATGAVGAATNVVGATTGGFFGAYPSNYGYGYPGYNTAYSGYNSYPGYNTAYNSSWSPIWGYTQTDPVYGTPTYTGRSAYRSYKQYRRSMDNPYN